MLTHPGTAVEHATGAGPTTGERAAEPTLRPGALAIVAFAFLLPVLWSSSVFNWFTTPKSALGLVALGPGLVVLGWMALRRDAAALAATAFLLVAALSTALAREPVMSLVGEQFAQNGLLLTATCVACWALGRTLDARARPALLVALVAGAAVNAAVAWLQMSTDLGIEALRPFQDRGTGLMGNPVQLAALCAAALWLVGARERDAHRPLVWWSLAALLIGAVELSGSRVATVLAVGVVGWHVVVHLRARRPGRAGALAAVCLAGIALAMVAGSSSTTTSRVSSAGSSGLGTRAETWVESLEALADRPVVGFGPGRYASVSTPRRTLAVARYEGPDVLYSDAHNLAVEYAVATGLAGLALLGTWLVLSARRAGGPLAGFGVVAAAVALLQPAYVGITALVALALGAAMTRAPSPRLADAPRAGRVAVALGAVLALVGATAGAALVAGDVHYARANARQSVRELDAAARWLPPWPQLPALRAQLVHRSGQEPTPEVVALARDTVARDEQDPIWWSTLGAIELMRGRPRAAAAAYREARRLNPWSYFALSGGYEVARELGDAAAARRFRDRLCRLGEQYCPPARERAAGRRSAGG